MYTWDTPDGGLTLVLGDQDGIKEKSRNETLWLENYLNQLQTFTNMWFLIFLELVLFLTSEDQYNTNMLIKSVLFVLSSFS